MGKVNPDIKQPWIQAGYECFAKEGPKGLKVEAIARTVHKSKSSFYHFFVDLEVYIAHLLTYHHHRAQVIGQKEERCENIIPDLVGVLLEAKTDLFFNRQLRIHREQPSFRDCIEQTDRAIGPAFMQLWAREMGLDTKSQLAESFFSLALENFYLQITEESFDYDWLANYFKELRFLLGELKK